MNKINVGNDLYLKGRIGWRGLSKNEYLEHSDYRIINATSLEDNFIDWNKCGYISKERYEESPEIQLKENDILISKDGTLGKVGYVKHLEIPSTVASGIFVLRNTCEEILNTTYLYQFLKSKMFEEFIYRNKSLGSTINHLYQRDLAELEIELPDLCIQDKVANILSLLDNKIAINTKINHELKNLAKVVFEHWFLQFDFPDEDGKPYKSSGSKMIWNEELKREIPEEWEFKTLNEHCFYNQENLKNTDDWKYINYLDTSNITCNKIDTIESLDCTVQKIPSRAKRKVTENAIVFSTVRPNQKHHGLIKKPLKNMVVSTGFVVITHKENVKINDLIYTFLTQEKIENQLQTIADTSVSSYPSINSDDIMNLKIVLPKDMKLLEKLSNKFYSLNQMIWQKNFEIKELTLMRDWLLPLLMNGQVTFKVEDDIKEKYFDTERVAETSSEYMNK